MNDLTIDELTGGSGPQPVQGSTGASQPSPGAAVLAETGFDFGVAGVVMLACLIGGALALWVSARLEEWLER